MRCIAEDVITSRLRSLKSRSMTACRGWRITSTGRSRSAGVALRTTSRIRRLMRLRSTALPITLPTVETYTRAGHGSGSIFHRTNTEEETHLFRNCCGWTSRRAIIRMLAEATGGDVPGRGHGTWGARNCSIDSIVSPGPNLSKSKKTRAAHGSRGSSSLMRSLRQESFLLLCCPEQTAPPVQAGLRLPLPVLLPGGMMDCPWLGRRESVDSVGLNWIVACISQLVLVADCHIAAVTTVTETS